MDRREPVRPAPAAPNSPAPRHRSDSGVRERAIRTNLAQASTPLVGRRRELSELRTLLAEHRLAFVVGPPGIGKTRLACEAARLLRDDYLGDGGAWRVDLAEASDGDSVCAAVARTLGLSASSPGRSAVATLGAALSARGRTLVVLDATEGCTVWLAGALTDWVTAAPKTEWIVTSRARFGVDGAPPVGRTASEGVLELGPVAAPGAGGGIPLAIELAAASLRASPGTPALDAAIQSACETLEAWQKDALAQLSVFAGGFDFEASANVLDLSHHGGTRTAVDAVGFLRDRALLGTSARSEEVGRIRYSMDRSVRLYARERLLDGAAREAALVRHARHYAALGSMWADRYENSHQVAEALAWLANEAENLLAVHRRLLGRGGDGLELAARSTLALDPLLAVRGPASMRLGLLDAALSAADADTEKIDPEIRIRLLEARSEAQRSLGHATQAVASAQAALAVASATGSKTAVGRGLRTLATLALMQGRLAEGRGLAEQAFAVDRETGERREEGRALGLLGSVEALEGDLETAWSTLDRAIAMHRELEDARFEAIDVGNLAVVAHDAGRLKEAGKLCDRALALSRQAANARLEGEVLALSAAVEHQAGRLDEARADYESALRLHRESGSRRTEATTLAHYGALLAELEDQKGARSAYARALSLSRECRDRYNEAFVLGALAALEARERSLDSARGALTQAGECLQGSSEPRARAALHLWRGHLELALARVARGEGDESRAEMLIAAARARIEQSATEGGEVRRVADVRIARRALALAVSAMEERPSSESAASSQELQSVPGDASPDALLVCAHGGWFRIPAGIVVSVARWRPLQRLLERLAERREIAPGEPLAVEALVAAGWPGERMLPKAGATRVYTAIASLRRLGLRGMLVRDDRGYRLREDVPISRVSRH